MGEEWIKISSTVALNRIRKDEELEKGWRKNEMALPAEMRAGLNFDPVHIVPLKGVESCRIVIILPVFLTPQRLTWVG